MSAGRTILVSGAAGLLGSRVCAALAAAGDRPVALVRRAPRPGADEVAYDPASGTIDAPACEGLDAIIHLGGTGIASGRWTPALRHDILASRVQGTSLIARMLPGLARPPRAFVCASAIGYYGPHGDEAVAESAPSGTGFLAEVCRAWEDATRPADAAGVRTVRARIGIVLAKDGGALERMLTPFRLGLGGPIGSGRQYMSWIALDDVVAALLFATQRDDLAGAVNVTAPTPVTNAEFGRTLGRVLGRPAVLPAPAFAIRLLLGDMGEQLILNGVRAVPARLEAAGFAFRHRTLEEALRAVLGR